MIRFTRRTRVALALGGQVIALAASGAAQTDPDSLARRALASRTALEDLARRLEASSPSDPTQTSVLTAVRARLDQGDFRPGGRILLAVQNEPALSDTFVVESDCRLRLPQPTVGALSLHGVLRSELEQRVTDYVSQFLREPTVAARPLLRLGVEGEVVRAGFYSVTADAVLADVVIAAGGATANADMKKLRIERNGDAIWEGAALRRAIAEGWTLDEAYLRDGDQVIVGRRRVGTIEGNLRFVWIVISIAGGVYGLSRAF